MSAVLKLAVLAFALAMLQAAFKNWLPAWAPLAGVLGLAAAAILIQSADLKKVLQILQDLEGLAGTEAFRCLIKAAGILLVTDYSCGLCRDAGLTAVGTLVEFGGRCLLLAAAWPLFSGILETVGALAGQAL